MRRRTLLSRGAVLAALGLAGCTGGPDDEPTTEPPTASPMSDTASATPTAEPTDTPTSDSTTGSPTASSSPTPSPTATVTADQEVAVAPGSRFRFEPASFEIAAGDTVRWIWEGGGHNVKPSTVPDGADWTGTSGGEFETFGGGHTYAYTFEVVGTYEYYCAPHRSSGMTGSFTVG